MADLYIKCADVDPIPVPIIPPKDPTGGGGGSGVLERDLTATYNVGGVTVGKTFTAGTPIEEVVRSILTGVEYPTLTPPKATLTTTANLIQENGAEINVPMTLSFNRGKIDPAFGTNGYRSGAATEYSLGGIDQASGSFTIPISKTNNTFTGRVKYGAGEQPKDSNGDDYSTALPAGVATSNTLTFEFVDALWGMTDTTGVATKQPLESLSVGEHVFQLADQTSENPMFFDVPASWDVTNVQIWNYFTQEWQDDLREFNVSTVTHPDASGNPVTYKRYTDNRGYKAIGREVRILWR